MMQTPVRYYITKDHDQPVVRSIPVTVPEQPRRAQREIVAVQAPQPAPTRTRVKKLVRAAMHRPHRDHSA